MEYTENTEPPTIFRKWVALSTIASVLQRKCSLPFGHEEVYPNMYVVLIGPSGSRKSTAMRPGRQLLQNIGVNLAAESTTREALIKRLSEAGSTTGDMDSLRVGLHSSMTVHSSEFAVFIGHNKPELIAALTNWYDSEGKWTYETKHGGEEEILNVWVNLIGATTPELLRHILPMEAITGGLTSRIIFIYHGSRVKPIAVPTKSERAEELEPKLAADLRAIYLLQGNFKMTEEALDYWQEFVVEDYENPPFSDYRFEAYMQRRRWHTLKLAMIINASRTDRMTLAKADLQKAVRWLKEAERNMPNVFTGIGYSDTAGLTRRVLEYVRMRKEVWWNELQDQFLDDMDYNTLRDITSTLRAAGYCKFKETVGTEGSKVKIMYTASTK